MCSVNNSDYQSYFVTSAKCHFFTGLHDTAKKQNLLRYKPGNRNHLGYCPLSSIFPKTCPLRGQTQFHLIKEISREPGVGLYCN